MTDGDGERPDLREASDVPESEQRTGSKTDSGLAGRVRSARETVRRKRTERKAKKLKRKARLRDATQPIREAASEASGLASGLRSSSGDGDDGTAEASDDDGLLSGFGIEPGDRVDADGDGFAEFEAIDTDNDGLADTLEDEPPIGDVEDDFQALDPQGVEAEIDLDFPVEDDL
jgi:hypothetical protein